MFIGENSLFIGGHWVPSESGMTYESLNPFTGGVATRASAATAVDVERAVDAAQNAFGRWASLPPSKRRQYLLAAANAVEARAVDIIEAITKEMGGPAAWGEIHRQGPGGKTPVCCRGQLPGFNG